MYKLLLIEDEALIRRGIVSLIDHDKLGISDVYEAADGESAWKLIEEHVPDIILSDINIPHIDGITLAKKVKSAYPDTSIVFLTGYDYFDYALEALKLGADDYVLKPISRKDVEHILTKLIKKKRTEEKTAQAKELLPESSPCSELEAILAENLSDPELSLKEIAGRLGFSVGHLSTLIKKELGMTFQEYVSEQRLAKAKLLLLTTEMKVYEVAESVGYDDVNYFSTRFKRRVGVTPRQYQKGMTKP